MKKVLFTFIALISLGFCYGQFGEQVVISSEINFPYLLNARDINEDGITDLVYIGEGNKIYWQQGLNNNGSFENPEILYNTGNSYREIKFFDIDLDGLEDIVFRHGSYRISYLKKIDSNGNFQEQQNLIDSNNFHLNNFQIIDFDSDGDNDIVAFGFQIGSLNSNIVSYENLNNQLIFDNENVLYTGSDFHEDKLYLTDIDGDGLEDIVGYDNFSDNGGVEIFYLKNNIEGDFDASTTIYQFDFLVSQQTTITSFVIADFNTDGLKDIIFTTYRELGEQGEYDRYWLESLDGAGSFSEPINSVYLSSFSVLGDLDNDEDLDIVFSDKGGTVIDWAENFDSTGNLLGKPMITNDVLGLKSIILSDINGDEYLDIISASSIDDKIAWYPNLFLTVPENEITTIKAYPNPIIDDLSVDFKNEITSIIIYNTLGEVIYQKQNNPQTISFRNQPSGVYFVSITDTTKNTQVIKVVKQ